MSNVVLTQYLEFANQLADMASDIACKYFHQSFGVSRKTDGTPVTIADQEIETSLCAMIARHYPHHAVMGEEYGHQQGNSEWCWVIDPIDGTKAFIAGADTFTTLIGLTYHEKPLLGLVSQPIQKMRWQAIYEGDPRVACIQSEEITLNGLRITTSSEGYFSPVQLQALEGLRNQGTSIHFGGDAYAYMMVLEGKIDAAFDVQTKPHDILPMLPVLWRGGVHTSFFDSAPTPHITGNVVASRQPHLSAYLAKLFCTSH